MEVFYPLMRGRKPGSRARNEELAGTVPPVKEGREFGVYTWGDKRLEENKPKPGCAALRRRSRSSGKSGILTAAAWPNQTVPSFTAGVNLHVVSKLQSPALALSVGTTLCWAVSPHHYLASVLSVQVSWDRVAGAQHYSCHRRCWFKPLAGPLGDTLGPLEPHKGSGGIWGFQLFFWMKKNHLM